jgi:hypothetical protein
VNGSRDFNRYSARMLNTILNKQLGRFFMNRIGLRLGGECFRTTR